MTRVERREFIVGTLSLLAAPLAAKAQDGTVRPAGEGISNRHPGERERPALGGISAGVA